MCLFDLLSLTEQEQNKDFVFAYKVMVEDYDEKGNRIFKGLYKKYPTYKINEKATSNTLLLKTTTGITYVAGFHAFKSFTSAIRCLKMWQSFFLEKEKYKTDLLGLLKGVKEQIRYNNYIMAYKDKLVVCKIKLSKLTAKGIYKFNKLYDKERIYNGRICLVGKEMVIVKCFNF